MPDALRYEPETVTRRQLDAQPGAFAVQFGTEDCGYCIAAEPAITEALSAHPDVQRVKVQDGRGRPLGRSFRVKLWPTVVVMHGGAEVARVVRPRSVEEVRAALSKLPG